MNKKIGICTVMVALRAALIGSIAGEGDPAKYIGTKSCKMCHKSEKSGQQFGIWEKGPIAKGEMH